MMAMLALAIGGDTISNQARREAVIDGLFDLSSKFSRTFLWDVVRFQRNLGNFKYFSLLLLQTRSERC